MHMNAQRAWSRVVYTAALTSLPLALGVGCDDLSKEASPEVTRGAAAERGEAAEPAGEAPESTAEATRIVEPKPIESATTPPSDAPPPDVAGDPIAFAKAHQGRRAPDVPAALACPEGTEERRGETAIFCRKREGYSIFHGPYVSLSRTGGVQVMQTMVEGKEHGVAIRYADSGTIQELRSFDHGKKHGTWATYDDDGKLQSVAPWRNDQQHGTYVSFKPDGTKRREEHYIDGVRSETPPQ
jgi:hypothetical protein